MSLGREVFWTRRLSWWVYGFSHLQVSDCVMHWNRSRQLLPNPPHFNSHGHLLLESWVMSKICEVPRVLFRFPCYFISHGPGYSSQHIVQTPTISALLWKWEASFHTVWLHLIISRTRNSLPPGPLAEYSLKHRLDGWSWQGPTRKNHIFPPKLHFHLVCGRNADPPDTLIGPAGWPRSYPLEALTSR